MKRNTIRLIFKLGQDFSILYLAFFLSIGLFTTSCDSVATGNDNAKEVSATGVTQVPITKYQNIDVVQFDIMREDKAYVVLDVRTPKEIAAGKIGEAVELDYFAPSFGSELGKLDKGRQYLVYCKVGGRSAKAAQQMIDLGFTNVFNLTGGYTTWYQAHPDNN